MPGKRVLIIGAGPSGLAILCQAEKLRTKGILMTEISCYEMQSSWGGQWNFTVKTGLDEYGEPVHSCMYRDLRLNAPKEGCEFGDYTFDEHFKEPITSFPCREDMFGYFQARWDRHGVKDKITFNRKVTSVTFIEESGQFRVLSKDLQANVVLPEKFFDYVICATGHYTTPNIPIHEGIETFRGRFMHSRDYRNAKDFRGMTVLVVGASYSADDIACQLVTLGGAEKVLVSHRKPEPLGYKWPAGVEERKEVRHFSEDSVTFKDGATDTIDAVILATGYIHHYPFMQDALRLRSKNLFFLEDLYKGVMYVPGGGGKLFYVGMQDQVYSAPMFDVQAKWILMAVAGLISKPGEKDISDDLDHWRRKFEASTTIPMLVDFQTDYILSLGKECDYEYNLDFSRSFHKFVADKVANLCELRSGIFTSHLTGTRSVVLQE